MNAAINQDVMVKPTTLGPLDLPGLEQVFYHPTFLKVINELEAPKGHENDFGGFKYRSAEDIQAALKPILLKYKCTVITRKFDTDDGFEVYAYIVFKDEKYMRCDLPGVATYDFVKDLASNKKISKTQQYAAYQSYAKKYALCNLLLIDDSQNDLDAFTNENIKNEKQNRGKQNYQNQNNNRVVTQADCDKALKQINDLPLDTPIQQATYIFDGLRSQYPEFDQIIYDAGCKKYHEIMHHLETLAQQQHNAKQNTAPASNNQSKGNTNTRPKNTAATTQQVQQQNNAQQTAANKSDVLITSKQYGELEVFIDERGLGMQEVCKHLAVDSLKQIKVIERMAHEVIKQ